MGPTLKKIIIKIGSAVWSRRINQEFVHNMKIIFGWVSEASEDILFGWVSEASEDILLTFFPIFFWLLNFFALFLFLFFFIFIFFVCLYVRKSLCDGSRPNGWTDCDDYFFVSRSYGPIVHLTFCFLVFAAAILEINILCFYSRTFYEQTA